MLDVTDTEEPYDMNLTGNDLDNDSNMSAKMRVECFKKQA